MAILFEYLPSAKRGCALRCVSGRGFVLNLVDNRRDSLFDFLTVQVGPARKGADLDGLNKRISLCPTAQF